MHRSWPKFQRHRRTGSRWCRKLVPGAGADVDFRFHVVGFIFPSWTLFCSLVFNVRNISTRSPLAHMLPVRPQKLVERPFADNVYAQDGALARYSSEGLTRLSKFSLLEAGRTSKTRVWERTPPMLGISPKGFEHLRLRTFIPRSNPEWEI